LNNFLFSKFFQQVGCRVDTNTMAHINYVANVTFSNAKTGFCSIFVTKPINCFSFIFSLLFVFQAAKIGKSCAKGWKRRIFILSKYQYISPNYLPSMEFRCHK
jgi:hypothetical protein